MTTLFTQIIKRQNPHYNDTEGLDLDRLLKFIFIESVANGGNKFNMLKRLILDNKFLKETDMAGVIDCFCNAQRVLHSLIRLNRKVNYRYSRTYDYNLDMGMNPLSQYKPHLLITLLENNTKYNFKLGDMITLIHKRLCNSNSFFPEPLDIVNPYTNIPLSYSSLYHLYFSIKASSFTMPTLFHQLFLCHFDISKFLDFNECLIKENIISDVNSNSSQRQKNKRLSSMMYFYRNHFSYKYYLDNHKALLEKVSHLHIHYLRTKYSLNPNIRFISERTIKSTLKRLRSEINIKNNNQYRRLAPDIVQVSHQNDFLFGQHNEIYDETEDEDYEDDELDETYDEDENDSSRGETIVTEQTFTMTTELINGSYQINTDVINEWLSTITTIPPNVMADALSESGDNTDNYDAVISITPTLDQMQPNEDENESDSYTETQLEEGSISERDI